MFFRSKEKVLTDVLGSERIMKKSVSKYIVLVSFCCITDEPHTTALVLSYSSRGHEWRSSWSVRFIPKSLMGLQAGCQPRGRSSVIWKICCKLTWFMAGLLPSGLLNWSPWVSATWAPVWGCPSRLKTWQATFPVKASNPREQEESKHKARKESHGAFYSLLFEVTCQFCCMLLVTQMAYYGRAVYLDVNSGGKATTHAGKSKQTCFHETCILISMS